MTASSSAASSDLEVVIIGSTVESTPIILGEGCIFYKGRLFWVDIFGMRLCVYSPHDRSNKVYPMPKMIGTVIPVESSDDEVLVALQDGIYRFHLLKETLTPLSDDALPYAKLPAIRFNDGKCDPSGRLWAGSMMIDERHPDFKGAAKLFMFDHTDFKAQEKLQNCTISNGIVWTADRKIMYYIDTPTCCVQAFDYDDSKGKISNGRVAFDVDPKLHGYPDGMCIDQDDNLWIAGWGGGCVTVRNPTENGKVLGVIRCPTPKITSCTFGGDKLTDLYITSSSIDADLTNDIVAGSVFLLKNAGKGLPAVPFKG